MPRRRTSSSCLFGKLPRDLFGRSQSQSDESQRSVGAARVGKRGCAGDEEIFVVVRTTEAVANAGRGIGAHAAAAGWMVQIISFVRAQDFSIVVARHAFEDVLHMLARLRQSR